MASQLRKRGGAPGRIRTCDTRSSSPTRLRPGAGSYCAATVVWFWYAVWLRVFSELGVPLRYLGASGRFASWALELRGGGNGDRDDQRKRDDRQTHPTSGGVEQLVPAGPIGFRLRRDLLSA